jgi:hypothetical protein
MRPLAADETGWGKVGFRGRKCATVENISRALGGIGGRRRRLIGSLAMVDGSEIESLKCSGRVAVIIGGNEKVWKWRFCLLVGTTIPRCLI